MSLQSLKEKTDEKQNYHPDNEIYHPFVKSMENILSAAEKSGTVRCIVFTQAGAALVNPDDGDRLGTKMDQVLNGRTQNSFP
jgi:enoyl-CoA hydratase/carnithine racemase